MFIGTFIVLLIFGIAALSYVPTPWEWKDSMKITCALYSAETAFFALIRIYLGLSKPLIAGAALHNLFEWSIVLHLISETTNVTQFVRNMQIASIWIIAVISLAIMIPNLMLAFLVEQTTGILLDFGMPLMFASQYFNRSNSKEVQEFYKVPLIAHTIHIVFTIVPLVMANFFVGTVSWYSSFWNEIVIYISAPVTHILYIYWSHEVDTIRANKNKNQSIKDDDDDNNSFLLPVQYRFKGAIKFIGIGFIMGLIMLLGVPTLIGPCTVAQAPTCIPSGPLTGTSVAVVNRGYEDTFIGLIEKAKLIESARKFKGNVNYKMVQNVFNPREFRFIETWDSYEAVNVWRNSTVPKTLFTSTKMKESLAGGTLTNFGAYKNKHATTDCTIVGQSKQGPKLSKSTATTSIKK
jgi:quinol monooxygenase YgiN